MNALVALPDNQHALSGSGDKTVKLFNVNDGAVLRTWGGEGIRPICGATAWRCCPTSASSAARTDKIARIVEIFLIVKPPHHRPRPTPRPRRWVWPVIRHSLPTHG